MTLRVGVTVKEGNKTRVQPYEGVVIAIHRAGVATTVTVRKTSQGFGVGGCSRCTLRCARLKRFVGLVNRWYVYVFIRLFVSRVCGVVRSR